MKKVFQFAAVALVAVMVSCSGGNGPEGSAKGYLDALMAEDFEKLKNSLQRIPKVCSTS